MLKDKQLQEASNNIGYVLSSTYGNYSFAKERSYNDLISLTPKTYSSYFTADQDIISLIRSKRISSSIIRLTCFFLPQDQTLLPNNMFGSLERRGEK